MSCYLIRGLKEKDNPAIAALIREVMTEFDCVGEGYSIEDPEVADMYAAYSSPGTAYFVLTDGQGNVCGGAGIGPLAGGSPKVCELKKMYTYPRVRGRGVGRKLLDRCLDAARKMGYTHCYLETVARMQQANRLYLSAGFLPLKERLGDTGHHACESYYLKTLTPNPDLLIF